MTAFDELLPVTLVADADTPVELASHAGRTLGLEPTTDLPTDGSGVLLGKFPGYARNTGAGWEWVIGPAQDPLLRAINRLPGTAGWTDLEARRVWRQRFRQMRENGVPSTLLQQWAPELYAAAVANHIAAPPPP